MEVYHFLVDSEVSRSQPELLTAARQAAIHTFGWPIGVVLDRDDARPRPTNDGIVAELKSGDFSGRQKYDYWALTKTGDFYALMSLFEDDRDEMAIFFDTRIVRTTEALLHAANIYRALGADPSSLVDFTVRYGGMRGRILKAASQFIAPPIGEDRNELEGESTVSLSFRLSDVESEIVNLVEHLCEPLFVLFNYSHFNHQIYERLVTNFVAGKVA